MILSPDETKLVTRDYPTATVHDLITGTRAVIEDEGYDLEPFPAQGDYFGVVRRGRRTQNEHQPILFSVHSFHDPIQSGAVLRAGIIHGDHARGRASRANVFEVTGDASLLNSLPKLISLGFPMLLEVNSVQPRIHYLDVEPPAESDGENGVKIVPCPDGQTVILTTDRSGRQLLVYDLSGKLVKEIIVAGGRAPHFRFRDAGRDVWFADGDTLYRIDADDWSIADAARRPDKWTNIMDLAFDTHGAKCAASYALRKEEPLPEDPRWPSYPPDGGQIVVFSVEAFKVSHEARLNEWMREVVPLAGEEVMVRAWEWPPREPFRQRVRPARMKMRRAERVTYRPRSKKEYLEEAFAALHRFVEKEGHAIVPLDCQVDGYNLGTWVGNMRLSQVSGSLESDIEERLNQISGWRWLPGDDFFLIKQFSAREGHTRVPQDHVEEGRALGFWVKLIREDYAKGGNWMPDAKTRARFEEIPGWFW